MRYIHVSANTCRHFSLPSEQQTAPGYCLDTGKHLMGEFLWKRKSLVCLILIFQVPATIMPCIFMNPETVQGPLIRPEGTIIPATCPTRSMRAICRLFSEIRATPIRYSMTNASLLMRSSDARLLSTVTQMTLQASLPEIPEIKSGAELSDLWYTDIIL